MSRRCIAVTGLGFAVLLVLATPLSAQQGEADLRREVERLRRQVHELRAHQEELVRELERRERGMRSDEEYAELIERLELGASALDELGCEVECDRVLAILEELRQERKRARGRRRPRAENEEVREVRRRIGVMRLAVEAFLEAGREQAAHAVEMAMHARELAIGGRRDPEAQRVRERAPNRGQLAELLDAAAGLQAEWGHADRAHALRDLAGVYAEQWRREQRTRGQRAHPEERGLDALERRVEVLRLAREAFAEQGREELLEMAEGAIHFGELMLEGAGPEDLSSAQQGVPSMGNLIELLQAAAGLYEEWGHPERAGACARLAEYYAARERSRRAEADELR